MTTKEYMLGEKKVPLPTETIKADLIDRLLPDEPELTEDQEVESALEYLEKDRSGSVHLTSPITERLIKGIVDERMTRLVQQHLRTCEWCYRMLRDTLNLCDVSADHDAHALLHQSDPWFTEIQERLDTLRTIPDNWDGDGTAAPNEISLTNTKRVLEILQYMNVRPNRIAPSAEEGIMVAFFIGKRYADIELMNTGEILAVTSNGDGNPQVWAVADDETAIKDALEIICDHIGECRT